MDSLNPDPNASAVVEPDATPVADAADEIGVRLAAVRAQRGMKVSELARRIGVSPSMISQIERGQSRPSVSTLFALAEEFEVPVDSFFRGAVEEVGAVPDAAGATAPRVVRAAQAADPEEPGDRYVVRHEDRALIDIEGGVRWERLTPTTLPHVEFLELVYGPHAESNSTLYRHPGMEMVLVLEGTLVIFIAFERYELGAGDSICFPSPTPHRYVNPGDGTTRAVTVILPESDEQLPPTNHRRP